MVSTNFDISPHDTEAALTLARQEITELHHEVLAHLEAGLHKGIRIGGRLIELQVHLKQQRIYENWIKANLTFSPRTAREYVILYRNRELIEHESANDRISIRAALKLIADTAKAVTPIEIKPCPLEIAVDVEHVSEEEDPVKLAGREILLVEAEPGFIGELVYLIRQARKAGRKIEYQKLNPFASDIRPNAHFQEMLVKRP